MEEANKLIGNGKKYLVLGKAVEAVSVLQEACGLLAKTFGDTADECGEAFFWCGKALLDLARVENSVLGNALEGVPEEDEDEDKPKDSNVESTEDVDEKTRDELRVQVYDAMAEKNEDAEKQSEESKAEGSEAAEQQNTEQAAEDEDGEKPPEAVEKEDKTEEEEETPAQESAAVEDNKTEEEEESADKAEDEEDGDAEMEEAEEQTEAAAEKESDDEEEVGNLQLAWEMLELAKVIYKRKDSKEDKLMAAQTHLKLGEVSAESGNYSQALDDFQECLKLQLEHLEPDSRLLAETHYQLGVTYSLNLQYSEAIEALNSSVSVIRSRLEKLQRLLDKAEGPGSLPEEEKELEELKALLPEIQEKVEDANEGLKTTSSAAEAVKKVLAKGSTTTAPVSNISHLVRKKVRKTRTVLTSFTEDLNKLLSFVIQRKPEGSPVKEADVKRVKLGDANGHTNKEVAT
uniref:Nuclear autoantigenic sperm protein n=2 Tax=Nothobranchius furzeri TaxID=105023 RepID=A0A8C6LJR3_NOTFU